MSQLLAIATRSASRAEMQESSESLVTLANGVGGDFRGKPGPRQVTVLCRAAWQAACGELGEALPWTTRRANLLVDEIDLRDSVGKRLRVGPVLLEISEETAPCRVMDLQRAGLRVALGPGWRGGVSCRVIEGGRLRVDDAVALEPSGSEPASGREPGCYSWRSQLVCIGRSG